MRKICKYCGKEFETTGGVYCSSKCHEQALISRHTFVCKGCGKSFYSSKFNVAYCTDQCRKRQSRLRHIHMCPTCIKIFFGPAGQIYCSTDCQHESKRTAERDHTCINCGKEFSRPKRNRDSCQFCSRDCAFEYKSIISRSRKHSLRIRRCGTCEKIFFLAGHTARYCSDKCRLVGAKNRPTYNSQDYRRGRFIPRKKECKNCGSLFMTEFKGMKDFCSDDCRTRYTKERERQRKHHRLDGIIIDDDITLTKLSIRDNGICQLCGTAVDWNDYEINKVGAWVAGARYPSIDHIYPICKGGKHSWNNVQLAHFLCNSLKGAGAG